MRTLSIYILFLLGALLPVGVLAQSGDEDGKKDVVLETNLPSSFNYQALIYANGGVVADKDIKMRLTLQDSKGKAYLEEEHTVRTSNTGFVSVEVGSKNPDAVREIPWELSLYVKAEVALEGTNYISLGAPVKMAAVPYALYARTANVIRSTGTEDEPIFQVQNSKGIPVFSVYEDGVRFNVSDVPEGLRRPRGGFAVRSFHRGNDGSYALTDRMTLQDGGANFFVDGSNSLRRPRGGFVVATLKSLRGGELRETSPLFQVTDRATYFTIDKCESKSTFQIRDREKLDEVIMNFTEKGEIQTQNKKEDVIKKLPNPMNPPTVTLDIYEPGTSNTDNLLFTNLRRWFAPQFKVDGKIAPYQLEIQNVIPNSEGKQLSDFIAVGRFLHFDGNMFNEVEGIMLRKDVVIDASTEFPKGTVVCRWLDYPTIYSSLQITPAQFSSEQTFSIVANTGIWAVQKIDEFYVTLSFDAFPSVSWKEVAANTDIKVTVTDSRFKDFLEVECSQNGVLVFKVIDKEGMIAKVKEVGTTSAGGAVQVEIGVKLEFPNNYESAKDYNVKLEVIL